MRGVLNAGSTAKKSAKKKAKSPPWTRGELERMYAALVSVELGDDLTVRFALRARPEYESREIRLWLSRVARWILCNDEWFSQDGPADPGAQVGKISDRVHKFIAGGRHDWLAVLVVAMTWTEFRGFLREVINRGRICREAYGVYRRKVLMVQGALVGGANSFAEILDSISHESVSPSAVSGEASKLYPGRICPSESQEDSLRKLWREMQKKPGRIRGSLWVDQFAYIEEGKAAKCFKPGLPYKGVSRLEWPRADDGGPTS